MKFLPLLLVFSLTLSSQTFAQKSNEAEKKQIMGELDKKYDKYSDLAQTIWGYAELAFLESKSSVLLQSQLKEAGFQVEAGVADMPTAFVATYGSGKPVIGILAEFDALPGVSQEAVPEKKPIAGQGAGHACGHHLFGVASMAAAIEVKDWLKRTGKSGTIKLYGTPAEEAGSGKIYMVRAGLFEGVDAVLHWHPGDRNAVTAAPSLANVTAKFRFYGVASHAAASPEKGRSALDGIEAMDYMVNMMREHIPSDSRIHYVITKGGEAPNVVPAFAESNYFIRHRDVSIVKDLWKRVQDAATGAALGTGTRVEWELTGGVYSLLVNNTINEVLQSNLNLVGGVKYTDEEKAFAQKMQTTFQSMTEMPKIDNAAKVLQPAEVAEMLKKQSGSGSTDVSDVSWVVPTSGISTATWVPGTAAHSWQAVAAGGMTIGKKGMLVAAKTLTLSAIDLMTQQTLIEKAKVELTTARGKDFKYESLVGTRKPPLDYYKP
jgi:aminobenzoyl-glutamate utilization protein B